MARSPRFRVGAPLTVLLGALLASSAHAVPARPFPIPLKNDDGSVVMGRMFGDERLSWIEDLSGYAIAFEPASGTWNLATRDPAGRLRPTALRSGHADPGAAGIAAHLRPGPELVRAALASRMAGRERPDPRRAYREATTRSPKNLVILVKFSDQAAHFQPADFEPVFNGESESVLAYYREVSYGTFELGSTIVGWVPLSQPASYYAYNDQKTDGHPEAMIHEAVAYLNAQGFDFTAFDTDGNGFVDAVDIVHSGEAYENSGNRNHIHSHFAPFDGMFFKSPATHDGLRFKGYHTEAEFGPNGYDITQIGVICHETAHFFGAPDLYDYDYDSAGLGMWSLMAAGSWGGFSGNRPSHPDAYTRMILGFAMPETLAADQAQVTLTPVEQGPTIILLDQHMPRYQYFLLENRQRIGFDQSAPGSGLLIYHVDENQYDQNDQNHYMVDLEQADGRRDLNRRPWAEGDAGDAYPLTTNNAFTPLSKPSSEPYLGLVSQPPGMASIWVGDIARSGPDVVFSLTFRVPFTKGEACTSSTECATGYCSDEVCCDRPCQGSCDACSQAAGATVDGTCTPIESLPCDDKKLCTDNDTCVAGVCQGTAKVCPPADDCHQAGVCQALDGTCLAKPKADGTGCNDGDQCTARDVCKAGVCTGEEPVACAALDSCHLAGACISDTGKCTAPVAADGTECAEGLVCVAGACNGTAQPDAGGPSVKQKGCGNCASAGAGLFPMLGLALVALSVRRRSLQSF